MTITFALSHQMICSTDRHHLAAGSRSYVYAEFDLLSDDWVPPITAVFGDYTVLLDDENQCLVPWEVLADPGSFSVSAFCADLHTTTCTTVTVLPGGYTEGQTPQPPTPSVYLALTGLVQQAVNAADAVQQRADAGEFNGVLAYNLLDNSDFRRPVAQAGIGGKHGNQVYAIDRWILTEGTISHQSGIGLTLNGTITQQLEFLPSGEISTFVGMASGTADITHSNGTVTITSSGGIISWAALYQGVYPQPPVYQPKGYAVELLACMRYHQILVFPFTPASNAAGIIPGMAFPIPMRAVPTVAILDEQGNEGYVSGWGNSKTYAVTATTADTKALRYVAVTGEPKTGDAICYSAVCNADL